MAKAPPDNARSISLQVVEGPHAGEVFVFAEHDTFLVGRSEQAHFCLPEKDPYFSRLHFLVEVNPPLCRLVDLRSKNGTQVNGQKVTNVDLKDGDVISGGTTVMRVVLPPTLADDEPTKEPVAISTASAAPSTVGFPTIPGYRILQELGRGGMGVVYRARRVSDQREVALKTIIPKVSLRRDAAERFLREAVILSQLQHPHIVAFLDMDQCEELVYFVMDLVPGTDASKLVKTHGPLSIGRGTRILLQVLDALTYAHEKGIVHRDLKPGNILIVPEQDVVKVADFGLARTYQESPMSGLTMSGDVCGTPQYMPPEQVLNFRAVKPAGDQYSAAATLYFLLTGQQHFEPSASVQDFYRRILQEEPVRVEKRREDIPKELADILHRALAREPAARFSDVLALRQALEQFSRGS